MSASPFFTALYVSIGGFKVSDGYKTIFTLPSVRLDTSSANFSKALCVGCIEELICDNLSSIVSVDFASVDSSVG